MYSSHSAVSQLLLLDMEVLLDHVRYCSVWASDGLWMTWWLLTPVCRYGGDDSSC